jgi:hypothetical protein
MKSWDGKCPAFTQRFQTLGTLDAKTKQLWELWAGRVPSMQPGFLDKTEGELHSLIMGYLHQNGKAQLITDSFVQPLPKSKQEAYNVLVNVVYQAIGRETPVPPVSSIFNLFFGKTICARPPDKIRSQHLIYDEDDLQVAFNVTPAGTFTDLHHGELTSYSSIGYGLTF